MAVPRTFDASYLAWGLGWWVWQTNEVDSEVGLAPVGVLCMWNRRTTMAAATVPAKSAVDQDSPSIMAGSSCSTRLSAVEIAVLSHDRETCVQNALLETTQSYAEPPIWLANPAVLMLCWSSSYLR